MEWVGGGGGGLGEERGGIGMKDKFGGFWKLNPMAWEKGEGNGETGKGGGKYNITP